MIFIKILRILFFANWNSSFTRLYDFLKNGLRDFFFFWQTIYYWRTNNAANWKEINVYIHYIWNFCCTRQYASCGLLFIFVLFKLYRTIERIQNLSGMLLHQHSSSPIWKPFVMNKIVVIYHMSLILQKMILRLF